MADILGWGNLQLRNSQLFFVGDVDDDGVVELFTEGMTYRGDYYDVDEVEAPFGVRWLEFALITCLSPAFPKNFCLLRLS